MSVAAAIGVAAAVFAQAPAPGPRPAPSSPSGDAIEQLADSFFAGYVARSAEPSLALIVVSRDGVLLQKGYGFEAGDTPVDPETTVFNVASLSKLITATAVMQQVERGVLSLDVDIVTYLPWLDERTDANRITVRHLLTHTSGLDAPFMRDVVARPSELIPLRDYFVRFPPSSGRPPGREIRYSNFGMALAAHLVEVTTSTSFDEYAERSVLAPLGMERSTFRQPPPGPIARRVATAGSGPVPDALLVYPSGSMVSTAVDMGRFMRAHLRGGELDGLRVLERSTADAMQRTQWTADSRMPGVALGFFETHLNGRRALFHTGARTHFSLMYLLPDEGVGIFVVHSMRQGGEFQTLRTGFVEAFLERFYPDKTSAAPAPVSDAAFSGLYRPILMSSSTIERAAHLGLDTRVRGGADGALTFSLPGTPAMRALAVSPGLYRVAEGTHRGLMIRVRGDDDPRGPGLDMSGSTQDPVSFDRLRWHQSGGLHLGLLIACYLTWVAWLGREAFAGVIRRRRGSVNPDTKRGRLIWRVATAAALPSVIAPLLTVALVLSHAGEDTAGDGLRFALKWGIGALTIGAAIAVLLVPLAAYAWRTREWTRTRRIGFATVAVIECAGALLLAHYHLVGWWF